MKLQASNFTRLDLSRIRRLLFYDIKLVIKQKEDGRYKVWVYKYSWIYTKAWTTVSAYRKIFKKLKEMGVYLP